MNSVYRGSFPSQLLSLEVRDLQEVLKGPALFFLSGQREPALLVSVLLHGNEHTGFLALREWLRPYAQGSKPLPRSVWVFIGNTAAANQNLRHLPGEPDFNRVWKRDSGSLETFAKEVFETVTAGPLFAAVDIHNNSGKNPHYACVSLWERRHIQLAALFGRTVIHSEHPATTFTHAFSTICPSVTLECGISGNAHGTQHAVEFLNSVVHLSDFPSHSISPQDVDGYETVARVLIRDGVPFTFSLEEDRRSELFLRPDLEDLNFSELPSQTVLGTYRSKLPPLRVENPAGLDPGLLSFSNGEIKTTRVTYPAMFTVNKLAILSDCLGYLMIHKPVFSELP